MMHLGMLLIVVIALGYSIFNTYLIFKDGRPIEAAILLLLIVILATALATSHVDRAFSKTKVRYTPKFLVLLRPLNAGSYHVRFLVPLETRRVREVQVPHLSSPCQACTGATS